MGLTCDKQMVQLEADFPYPDPDDADALDPEFVKRARLDVIAPLDGTVLISPGGYPFKISREQFRAWIDAVTRLAESL